MPAISAPPIIPAAALDSNIYDLASFGILDSIKKIVEYPTPPEEEEPAPVPEGGFGTGEPGSSKIDLDIPDDLGCTPLIWAARVSATQPQSEPHPPTLHAHALTPLFDSPRSHARTQNGHNEVLQYFLSKNASHEHKSFDELSALHHAANGSHEQCVLTLIAEGADCNAQDKSGNTPLHIAASRGVLNIVVRLLDAGAEPSAANIAGATPLHRAAVFGQIAIVKKLMTQTNVDAVAVDVNGDTALHYAAACGFAGVITTMLKAGCDPTGVKNKIGLSPADVALNPAIKKSLVDAVVVA
jgi:ankyrin repeat protein